MLTWHAGREVHFSDDEQAVEEGLALVATVDEDRYDPGALELQLGESYYWRVDEVNEAEAVVSWEGDLWDFTISEFLVVDDFERYTDDEGRRIYGTWVDGYEIGDNGSQVGYQSAPFAERRVVYSGR